MNVMDEIRKAEAEAADVRRDAAARARDLVAERRLEAQRQAERSERAAAERATEFLAKSAQQAEAKANGFVEAEARKGEAAAAAAEARLPQAIELIVSLAEGAAQ